jgi:hypothetical protein
MRRSCVITHPVVVNDGKPFEALKAYFYRCRQPWFELVVVGGNVGTDHVFHTENEMDTAIALLHLQLAQALNPPIKVSKLVLKAMEKVPEASFWYVEGSVNVRLKWDETLKTFTVNGQTLSITDYIQADCPLALQVLFQFNTEGQKYA